METHVISLTLKQLAEAVYSGAYSRFVSLGKKIAAGHANRKTPAAVRSEMQLFEERRDAIVVAHKGKINSQGDAYEWPGDGISSGAVEMTELLEQKVELPGKRISMADLLDGKGLRESDYDLLEPWVAW